MVDRFIASICEKKMTSGAFSVGSELKMENPVVYFR